MKEKTKQELFEKVLLFENMSACKVFNGRNYHDMATASFEMLVILGLDKEYIKWSIGK